MHVLLIELILTREVTHPTELLIEELVVKAILPLTTRLHLPLPRFRISGYSFSEDTGGIGRCVRWGPSPQ